MKQLAEKDRDSLLKLENQLCFPFYAVSRIITRAYQPLLEKIHLTYPQYLVMMVLWEQDGVTVNYIADKLLLNTNTISPLLKRLEKQKLIKRTRKNEDERKVTITLTAEGIQLKEKAFAVPEQLLDAIQYPPEALITLKENITDFLSVLLRQE